MRCGRCAGILELGEFEAAIAVYQKSSRSLAGWHPQESDWVSLIQAVLDHNDVE